MVYVMLLCLTIGSETNFFPNGHGKESFCQNQHYSDYGDDPTGKVLATEAYRFEFKPPDLTVKSQLGLFTCVTPAGVRGRGERQNPGQSINPKFRERPCLKR